MTRLATSEIDFDVWYERREADKMLARIGFDPDWRQHRAYAASDVAAVDWQKLRRQRARGAA